MKQGLFQRDDLLRHAHLIITKDNFTHEDNARANALMNLAEKLGDGTRTGSPNSAESRQLDEWLRRDTRALGVGTPSISEPTSILVHQAFYDRLVVALKAFDALFNEDVVTVLQSDTGAPLVLPNLDDTAQSAELMTEGEPDVEAYPITAAKVATAPTYRSKIVRVSGELVTDSNFPLANFLAAAFAIRLARGVGPDLVSALLSAALVGRNAIGDDNQGDPDPTSQVGYLDLVALVRSVNSAYRAVEKVFWLLNDDTLLTLDNLRDRQGRPLLYPQYDAQGRRLLLGFPCAICPSMPDIGPGATPIAFGATSYFVTRVVKNATRITSLFERWAEYGQTGFRTQMRANGVLLGVTSNGSPTVYDSPVKLLQNASS